MSIYLEEITFPPFTHRKQKQDQLTASVYGEIYAHILCSASLFLGGRMLGGWGGTLKHRRKGYCDTFSICYMQDYPVGQLEFFF